MLRGMEQKFHIFGHRVLAKTVHDEFNSVTYVVRNITMYWIRNSEIITKTNCKNAMIKKFVILSGFLSSFSHGSLCSKWLPFAFTHA